MNRFYAFIAFLVSLLILGCTSHSVEREPSHPIVYYESQIAVNEDSVYSVIDQYIQNQPYIDKQKLEVCVFNLSTNRYLYSYRDTVPVVPASCLKVLTALTALDSLGLNHRYESRVELEGVMKQDTLMGNVRFVMDDDPLLENFSDAVSALKGKGIRCIKGRLLLCMAREDTLRAHPSAKTWDIPYHKLPVLLRGRRYAERNLQYQVAASGIRVLGDTTLSVKAKPTCIYKQHSRLTDVITPMLIHSSNIKADALAGHLGASHHTTQDGVKALERFCRNRMNVDISSLGFSIYDGSGLSPDNRLNARFLVSLLRYAYDKDEYFEYLIDSALVTPGIADRAGSLKTRLYNSRCVGHLYCKTGTLVTEGASGLTGYILTDDDEWLAFSMLSYDCPVAESRRLQDNFCRLFLPNIRR